MTTFEDSRPLDFPPTDKTRIVRLNEMACYDCETVLAVLDFGVWAGVLPIRTVIDPPEDDPRLKAGFEAPDYRKTLRLG